VPDAPPILAEFAAPAEGAAALGDVVRRRAPVIFRAGDYEFLNAPPFRMTPDDIRRAVEEFEPTAVVDTHVPSIFNGKLASTRIVGLTPTPDYTQFGADVELDRWLHELFKGEPLACSVTFDRHTKKLKNLALVPNPRIPDAAIEAAFAAEEERRQHTPHGQAAMQDIHDRAAQAGARCNPDAAFTADHEGDALQEMHDTAVKHGAVCKTYPAPEPEKPKKPAKPQEAEEAPMSTPAPAPAPAPEWEARFAAQDQALAELKAENEALRKASAALQQDNRAERLRRIEKDAADFAREQLSAGKADRVQLPDIADEYVEAAVADLDAPREVTFAAGDGKPAKGTRVDKLKAKWGRVLASEMRRQRVSDRDGSGALFDRGGAPEPMPLEERKKLWNATGTGQTLLREEAQARTNGR
jgi:hypothetical protein